MTVALEQVRNRIKNKVPTLNRQKNFIFFLNCRYRKLQITSLFTFLCQLQVKTKALKVVKIYEQVLASKMAHVYVYWELIQFSFRLVCLFIKFGIDVTNTISENMSCNQFWLSSVNVWVFENKSTCNHDERYSYTNIKFTCLTIQNITQIREAG